MRARKKKRDRERREKEKRKKNAKSNIARNTWNTGVCTFLFTTYRPKNGRYFRIRFNNVERAGRNKMERGKANGGD